MKSFKININEEFYTKTEILNLIPVITDNLTTNDSSKVLSAKQGKILKDSIDELVEDIHTLIYGTGE